MDHNSVAYIRKFGHQTRNALGRIKSVVDFLKPEMYAQLDDEQRAMVFDVLNRGLEASEHLVDKLVKAKVFTEQDLPKESLDFADILRKQLSLIEQKHSAKQMQTVLNIPESLICEHNIDFVTFAFYELLDNAFAYGEQESYVYISLQQTESAMPCFDIKNTTAETESLEEAGTPYYRSQLADSMHVGAGLSLYALKMGAKQMGATFTFAKNGNEFSAKLCF